VELLKGRRAEEFDATCPRFQASTVIFDAAARISFSSRSVNRASGRSARDISFDGKKVAMYVRAPQVLDRIARRSCAA